MKAIKGVAFCYSPEIFAVLVGKAVEDESCEFVHALAVCELRVDSKKDVDDAGEAVVVVSFLSIQRQVDLALLESVFLNLLNLNLKFLSEKLAIGFSSHRVLLDHVPQLLILEEGLPF